jgi:hypothetical protein
VVTPPESTQVVVELERMRGEIRTGFAEVNGRLDLALQRADQTEADIAGLDHRVTVLERGRWPLPSVAAVTGLAGLGASLYAIVGK